MRIRCCNPLAFVDLGRVKTRSIYQVASAAVFSLICLGQAAQGALYFTSGHGDIGVEYEDGELHLHVHLGEGSPAIVNGVEVYDEEYEPGEIAIQVPNSARVVLGSSVAYLGAAAGSSIWLLPSSGTASTAIGSPFLGWATEELDAADWTGNLTFSLVSAVSPSGNGNFAAWQTDAFGDLQVLAMSTAVGGALGISQAPGNHDHYNVGFTEPGMWEVTIQVSGVHAQEGAISGTETFRFNVVPEPSVALLGIFGLAPLVLRRRR